MCFPQMKVKYSVAAERDLKIKFSYDKAFKPIRDRIQ